MLPVQLLLSEVITVEVCDSFTDGWNGNVLTIGSDEFGLASGASGSGAVRGTATSNIILDITNTTNQKVKFNTSSFGGTGIGSSTVSNSTFVFIRLGDT